MTLEDLQTLLDYHYWARDRALDAASLLTPEQFTRDMGSSFRSVRDTLAHTFSAEWAWHQRWLGTSPTAHLLYEDYPDLETLRASWTRLEGEVRTYLQNAGEDGIGRVYSYRTLNGQPGQSPLWQMVQHVVNHASYHRGQVTTLLRQLGVPPGKSMDMVAFYREQALVRIQ